MSNNTKDFSIIIPFKSGKQYLLDCLYSALAQDYPHFNILILADNTSNFDESLDAVYALKNSKISVHLSNQNLDILQNWGRIKEIAKNEYMTILGYDDILEKSFLSTINNLINQEPEASLYHSHFKYINSKGAYLKNCKPLPSILKVEDYLQYTLHESIDIMATGYVFKSSDYDAIGGIPTHYPNLIYADLQLWLDLTKKSYLAVDSSIQFSFRIHASTTKTSTDAILFSAFLLFLDYLNQLKNESIKLASVIQENGKIFTESTTKAFSHRLLRTQKNHRKGLTIDTMISEIDKKSRLLEIRYAPLKVNSIRVAKIIESVPLFNNLFLLFKKVYKKPILNK